MTQTMERANKVSVNVIEGGFEAKFFRTHKHIKTIASVETGFQPQTGANKTAQREAFRVYITENASLVGIDWDPQDKRSEDNKRQPKYTSDGLLQSDAVIMVWSDIEGFTTGCKIDGLELVDVVAESITPMTQTAKGTDLSKMGIIDGKYGNGNWAWANIEVTATLKYMDTETYVTMSMQLASGQLKKPVKIGDGGYNQTSFKNEILRDIKDLMPKVEAKDPIQEIDNTIEAMVATGEIEAIAEEAGITVTEAIEQTERIGKGKRSSK